jgi:hypothetical protein
MHLWRTTTSDVLALPSHFAQLNSSHLHRDSRRREMIDVLAAVGPLEDHGTPEAGIRDIYDKSRPIAALCDLPDGAWKFAKAASTCIIFALALVGKSIAHRAFACLVGLPSRVEFLSSREYLGRVRHDDEV